MFSILKFLGGFNILNGEKLGKLIFYAILIAIGIGAYHKIFISPTKKTTQKAERIINYNYDMKQTFGCNHFPKMIKNE